MTARIAFLLLFLLGSVVACYGLVSSLLNVGIGVTVAAAATLALDMWETL